MKSAVVDHVERRRIARAVWRASFYILVIILCAVSFFPIYWTLTTALSLRDSQFTYPPRLTPILRNWPIFIRLFRGWAVGTWLKNTVFVGLMTMTLTVTTSIFAGYSLSRFRYRGKSILQYVLLMTQMFPPVLIVVPLYVVIRTYRLIDSLYSLVLGNSAYCIPVCVWMFKGFFDSIPPELEEAGLVDGCTRVTALLRITLPLSASGILATAAFAFLSAYDEFLFARTFINSNTKWVASLGMSSFIGRYQTWWNEAMSAAVIVAIPALVLFAFFQRYLIRSLTAGALKG